jgi:hypothetical protein
LRCYARRFVSGIDVLCAAMTMQKLVFVSMRAKWRFVWELVLDRGEVLWFKRKGRFA